MVQAAAAEANDMESIEAAEHAVHTAQVEADRCVLRLYTKLVQADRQARALEAVLQLQTDNALNGALKIAYHHRYDDGTVVIALFVLSIEWVNLNYLVVG